MAQHFRESFDGGISVVMLIQSLHPLLKTLARSFSVVRSCLSEEQQGERKGDHLKAKTRLTHVPPPFQRLTPVGGSLTSSQARMEPKPPHMAHFLLPPHDGQAIS
jgi:hypothetical protein